MLRILRRRGQRSLRISVSRLGRVTLSAPRWVPLRILQAFFAKHAAWVQAQLAKRPSVTHAPYSAEERRQARELVERRLAYFNHHYGFTFRAIRLKNTATRWGSCSARGNLNFHVGICRLPPELADYLIVHELCHLKELNHGPQFWGLVAETIPEPERKRHLLKRLIPESLQKKNPSAEPGLG
jgi:predicted metal-dependent hydrolase